MDHQTGRLRCELARERRRPRATPPIRRAIPAVSSGWTAEAARGRRPAYHLAPGVVALAAVACRVRRLGRRRQLDEHERPPRRPDARGDRSRPSVARHAEGPSQRAGLDRRAGTSSSSGATSNLRLRRAGEAFVLERVDVIVAFEDTSIDAAETATLTVLPSDPDRLPPPLRPGPGRPRREPVAPGGNLTGVFGPRDVVAKQLEVYQALVPQLRRVLTLVDPKRPENGAALRRLRGRRSAPAPTARAGRSRGLDRKGSQAHLPLAAPGRSRRRVPPLEQPPAQPLGADRSGSPSTRWPPGPGAPEGGVEQGALFSYGVDLGRSASRCTLRRQHPQGHLAGRPARRGAPRRSNSRSISRPPAGSASSYRRR